MVPTLGGSGGGIRLGGGSGALSLLVSEGIIVGDLLVGNMTAIAIKMGLK